MSRNLKSLFVFFLLVITVVMLVGSTQPVYAQILPPDPCPFPPCNPDVPISGIEFLIGLGAAYGIRKLNSRRKGTS
jgi:hypothetical protein